MAVAEALETGMEPIPDEVLIERVGNGDQDAFNLLYERYFPRVYRFVSKRLRNRADTEETVQEVFINIFNSMASFRGEAPFAAWVLGLSRRTVARRFKKKQHPTVPLLDEEPEATEVLAPGALQREATPHENYELRERLIDMEFRASHVLNAEQRELFERHHLRHQSIQDIALELRKSEDAVKSNLYRARKLLFAS